MGDVDDARNSRISVPTTILEFVVQQSDKADEQRGAIPEVLSLRTVSVPIPGRADPR